jgi:WD40 repeat protein
MQSLIERFCPNVHDAAITAASFDPTSGTIVTADADGVVAVQRAGEASPRLVFQPGTTVNGALAVIRGGSLIAVGDDAGTVGVYRTQDGEPTFLEQREGARGRVRAMHGVALNPEGSTLAAIAADGLLRVWDITRDDRNAWRGFSGDTVEFDARGHRLLAMDESGQPRLMDLASLEALYMDKLQTPANKARFTLCGTMVVAAGSGGVSLLRVQDGALIASFATRGGSGIHNLLLAPDGQRAGAVSQRSVHVFTLPGLEPVDSFKHGAPDPSGAAVWHMGGVRVGGADGLMHGGGSGSLGPVDTVVGIGPHRVLMHHDVASVWNGDDRQGIFKLADTPSHVAIDREGRLLVTASSKTPVQVYAADTGKPLFDGGPETRNAQQIEVGGEVVAVQLASGGIRWWHLSRNRGFSLPWPTAMALSGSGTWLGVVTPGGTVRIIDPQTGEDAVAAPAPITDTPVRHLAFVNRSPELLVFDDDGVLAHYDLTDSVQKGQPAQGRDILSIHVPVDRVWGITGGDVAVLRLPDGDHSTLLWIDIHSAEVRAEVRDLERGVEVDVEHGRILQTARAGALIETDSKGTELRVLRDLPDGEWISFGPNGIMSASEKATGAI